MKTVSTYTKDSGKYTTCLNALQELKNEGFEEVQISWTKKHQLFGMVEKNL